MSKTIPDPTRTPIPSLLSHDVVPVNALVCSRVLLCSKTQPSNLNLLRLPHPQPHSRHSPHLGSHPAAQFPPLPAPQRRRQEPRHGRPSLFSHSTIPVPIPIPRRSRIHRIRPKLPKKEPPLLLRRLLLLLLLRQPTPASRILIPQSHILVKPALLLPPLALLRRQGRLVLPPPLVAQRRPREARGHGRRRGEERRRALLLVELVAAAVVHGVEALACGGPCVVACDDGALGADVLHNVR